MSRKILRFCLILSVLPALFPLALAEPTQLHSVAFPERQAVDLPLVATPKAPSARLYAEVTHKKGQSRVELYYESMKPAILFGGDVTCYVVWAVTRDGAAANLGELTTRKASGKLTYRTGHKQFALLVTAEAYYLVNKPSELVVFKNVGPVGQSELSSPFMFDQLAEAPRHSMDAISHLKWDSSVPLELLQARKAYELATRYEAPVHAAEIHEEAGQALEAANDIARGTSRGRELLDASRRAVALSNEALNIAIHRIEALEVERELARRRQETAALERRAAEAEATAEEARRLSQQLREEAGLIRLEKERMVAETTALRTEKATLEIVMAGLRQEKLALESESERLRMEKSALELESARLQQEKAALVAQSEQLQREKLGLEQQAEKLRVEKAALSGRLESALSHVADTTESARGYVVNLPDILFDVNEASLKPGARLTLAKLTGILLIMPDQRVLIEGHTDSTGSAEYNLDLSQRRANSVLALLRSQGLDPAKLRAVGYGMDQPVAENDTPEGRKRNRRVEIIISGDAQTVAAN